MIFSNMKKNMFRSKCSFFKVIWIIFPKKYLICIFAVSMLWFEGVNGIHYSISLVAYWYTYTLGLFISLVFFISVAERANCLADVWNTCIHMCATPVQLGRDPALFQMGLANTTFTVWQKGYRGRVVSASTGSTFEKMIWEKLDSIE